MPPKRIVKKRPPVVRCDRLEGDRFHAPNDDVFRFNWWEVFCFPYILGARVWECCVSLCTGTNQCMVYWMLIQWIVCKITRITTPDPIIFPYFFYMFCQVILLTLFFGALWWVLGDTVVVPYLKAFYKHVMADEESNGGSTKSSTESDNNDTARLSFRRYCFRKGEIFDTSLDSFGNSLHNIGSSNCIFYIVVDLFIVTFI